jgi:hypothetical protein
MKGITLLVEVKEERLPGDPDPALTKVERPENQNRAPRRPVLIGIDSGIVPLMVAGAGFEPATFGL